MIWLKVYELPRRSWPTQALIARMKEQADELFWFKRFNTGATIEGR